MPTVESRLIQDMNMKSFTIHYLIPHYLINMRFLTIIQVSRLTSKQVLIMEPMLLHTHISTKNNPDNSYWNEAMHEIEYKYYIAAMKKEIAQLVKQKPVSE